MEKEYLPIGSIVLLKNSSKKLMITGYCVKPDDEKSYDYLACLYPEGIVSSSHNYIFNQQQIDKVVFKGYADEENEKMNSVLNDISDSDEDDDTIISVPIEVYRKYKSNATNEEPITLPYDEYKKKIDNVITVPYELYKLITDDVIKVSYDEYVKYVENDKNAIKIPYDEYMNIINKAITVPAKEYLEYLNNAITLPYDEYMKQINNDAITIPYEEYMNHINKVITVPFDKYIEKVNEAVTLPFEKYIKDVNAPITLPYDKYKDLVLDAIKVPLDVYKKVTEDVITLSYDEYVKAKEGKDAVIRLELGDYENFLANNKKDGEETIVLPAGAYGEYLESKKKSVEKKEEEEKEEPITIPYKFYMELNADKFKNQTNNDDIGLITLPADEYKKMLRKESSDVEEGSTEEIPVDIFSQIKLDKEETAPITEISEEPEEVDETPIAFSADAYRAYLEQKDKEQNQQ